MKHILKSALLLLCGAAILTACDDDRDSNPTIELPTTFKLNTPAYSNIAMNLAKTENFTIAWSQPDYGFPVNCEYTLELNTDETFAKAPFMTMVCPTPEATISGSELNTKLQVQEGWQAETDAPAEMTIFARVLTHAVGASSLSNTNEIESNVISFKVAPYYVNTSVAAPELWYLVGDFTGAGNWKNADDAVGLGLVPFYASDKEEYDVLTGQGVISYTGYFLSSRSFKLVKTPGGWNDQWGTSDGALSPVKNDGGSQNFVVPADGYYTITLNTATDELSVEAYTGDTPSIYAQMLIAGDFNGWTTDTQMTAVYTFSDTECHDWYFDLDASSGDTTAKFLTDSSWSVNWGDTSFPFGKGSQNGPNIPVLSGKYRVFFNDITGQYQFLPL